MKRKAIKRSRNTAGGSIQGSEMSDVERRKGGRGEVEQDRQRLRERERKRVRKVQKER